MTVGVSLLIPTYNRADVLGETLDALAWVQTHGLDWEVVIIDNNSIDATYDVVAGYRQRLPITYLKEVRPGKNCALNRALREKKLRDLVVFADDDITPASDWLTEIVASALRWPAISVFGGRIRVRWPGGSEPAWATSPWVKSFGFSWHEYAGDREVFYEPPACPLGPNFWVRRAVFDRVPFFDESIGPRPHHRVMGSETSFLMELQRLGFKILYCPRAQVEHRIDRRECSVARLRRRGYGFGRGQVRLFGLHRAHIYRKSKLVWSLMMGADCAYTAIGLGRGLLRTDSTRRCEMTVTAMIRFGQIFETVNQLSRGGIGTSHFDPDRMSWLL